METGRAWDRDDLFHKEKILNAKGRGLNGDQKPQAAAKSEEHPVTKRTEKWCPERRETDGTGENDVTEAEENVVGFFFFLKKKLSGWVSNVTVKSRKIMT
jgi:hypothetical protein